MGATICIKREEGEKVSSWIRGEIQKERVIRAPICETAYRQPKSIILALL